MAQLNHHAIFPHRPIQNRSDLWRGVGVVAWHRTSHIPHGKSERKKKKGKDLHQWGRDRFSQGRHATVAGPSQLQGCLFWRSSNYLIYRPEMRATYRYLSYVPFRAIALCPLLRSQSSAELNGRRVLLQRPRLQTTNAILPARNHRKGRRRNVKSGGDDGCLGL